MKRIVVLIDGTWNKEEGGADTNVAKLDSAKKIQAFIKATAVDDILQHVHYHDGVGSGRPPIILEADARWYVGPGHGLFELVQRRATSARCWDRVGGRLMMCDLLAEIS